MLAGMTDSMKHALRLREIRSRMEAIAKLPDAELTPEIRTEATTLTTEYATVETRLAAATVAEAAEVAADTGAPTDPETRERLELRSRASLGAFVLAHLQGREPAGAEAEYRSALGIHTGIPVDLWEADRPAPSPETRAVTPAPATGTGVTVAPIQPFVFAPSIAPRLGIEMRSVGSGGYSEMTITTALPAAPKAKSGDADDTAAALTAITANPRRISARMSLAVEDIAAVGQANFESALRQNVSMALSDAYDDQCINGDGTAPNVEGLIDQLTDPANPAAVATFASMLKTAADEIDGLWASKLTELGIVVNVDVYRLSAQVFRAASADLSFSDYARSALSAWWTNKRMPATPSAGGNNNIARGIVYRMGRPGLRTACHPTWGTISIDDIYTSSRSGVRHFTVHTLVGDKVLIVQPDAYGLVEYKVA